MVLNGTFSLFDIENVESFCRAVINEHMKVGVRSHGTLTGPSSLTLTDQDDLLAYLISLTWELSRKFNTTDDGRGTNRFSGYALSILHKRIVDWQRSRFGSTRYGPRPVVELTDDERLHVADLVDLTGPEVLDLVNSVELAPAHRRTLANVVIPMVFNGATAEDYARKVGKPVGQVNQEIGALRRALVEKHLIAA